MNYGKKEKAYVTMKLVDDLASVKEELVSGEH